MCGVKHAGYEWAGAFCVWSAVVVARCSVEIDAFKCKARREAEGSNVEIVKLGELRDFNGPVLIEIARTEIIELVLRATLGVCWLIVGNGNGRS